MEYKILQFDKLHTTHINKTITIVFYPKKPLTTIKLLTSVMHILTDKIKINQNYIDFKPLFTNNTVYFK